MTDLAAWLLDRIAEDEGAARRAAFGYGAAWRSETDDAEDWSVVHADGQRDMVGSEDGDVTRHIARWDPVRVLAECDAKRRIVVSCQEMQTAVVPMAAYLATVTLRNLALPYADQPGYREGWRP